MISAWVGLCKPGLYNLPPIRPGADWEAIWTSYDAAGNPVNFTDVNAGYTALAMIRLSPQTANPSFLTFSTTPAAGQGQIVLGGSAGTTKLILTNSLTLNLPGGFTGKWDILYSSGDATPIITPLLAGAASTLAPVTHS